MYTICLHVVSKCTVCIFFFKIISWVPLLQDRKRPASSSFYKGKPPKLCTLQLHMISAMPITIATPKAFSCYRFLMLGIPWTQSMPSCDVNAAMRLAEANWRRDKGYFKDSDADCTIGIFWFTSPPDSLYSPLISSGSKIFTLTLNVSPNRKQKKYFPMVIFMEQTLNYLDFFYFNWSHEIA